MSKIVIATRGSQLALWQANFVAKQLEGLGFTPELNVIKTSGDKILNEPLYDIGGKGLFIKELETALLEREADIAVHSLKDMPAVINKEFLLPCIQKRHSYHDLLIVNESLTLTDWSSLSGKTVGTSSLRRQYTLKALNPDIQVKSLRGNIDTRLGKLKDGNEFDAIILAEASLERLGLKDNYKIHRLPINLFVPCAAQGAIAVECLKSFAHTEKLGSLNDPETAAAVSFERNVVASLGADCQSPLGCLAFKKDGIWQLSLKIMDYEGHSFMVEKTSEKLDLKAKKLLLSELKNSSAQQILDNLGLTLHN